MNGQGPRVEPVWDSSLEPYRLPDGRALSLFALLSHSPAALADLKSATARALMATALPTRLRELLILRILARLEARSEWDVHVILFGDALHEDDLSRLRQEDPGFSSLPAAIVALADALCERGSIQDEVWNQIEEGVGVRQAIEATFIGAQYVKVALMENVLRAPSPFLPGTEGDYPPSERSSAVPGSSRYLDADKSP